MTQKKLLIVAGAGASIPFDMQSVAAVHNHLEVVCQQYFSLAGGGPRDNLYTWVHQQVRAHWLQHMHGHLFREPNFEDVLYAIYSTSSFFPAGIFTSVVGALVDPKQYPAVNFIGMAPKVADSHMFSTLGNFIGDEILKEFRTRCANLPATHTALLAKMKAFLGVLGTRYQISLATMNYDDIIYRCLPTGSTGFDKNGEFSDQSLFRRKEWASRLHMHGSVHFDMRLSNATNELHRIYWQEDLNAQFQQNAFGRSNQQSSEGIAYPTSAIIAGNGKTAQLLRRPFRSYYAELDHLANECDAVLFIGYGFNDHHINEAFSDFRDDRRRPVVVIDFAKDDTMTASGSDMGNPTSVTRAMGTFGNNMRQMRANDNVAPDTVRSLKAAFGFDRSTDPKKPLSIWYNGTADALDHAQEILAELDPLTQRRDGLLCRLIFWRPQKAAKPS